MGVTTPPPEIDGKVSCKVKMFGSGAKCDAFVSCGHGVHHLWLTLPQGVRDRREGEDS